MQGAGFSKGGRFERGPGPFFEPAKTLSHRISKIFLMELLS